MKTIKILLIGCLIALTAACGQSESPSGDTSTAERDAGTASATATTDASAGTAPTITISGMAFGEPITVPPGALISVANTDRAEHSVTSRTPDRFDVHVDGNEKATFTAPTEPGTYEFFCTYHPNMTGSLIVT
ncbi:cupredoxin domain-containing protein [Mycobacterium sp. NPDC050041]|uniref:cupredoxin domain-containing protein n=1 Tax=Mycobacterium sp. NPDC050041 TaxID=3364293 RepID=UPI003C2B183E